MTPAINDYLKTEVLVNPDRQQVRTLTDLADHDGAHGVKGLIAGDKLYLWGTSGRINECPHHAKVASVLGLDEPYQQDGSPTHDIHTVKYYPSSQEFWCSHGPAMDQFDGLQGHARDTFSMIEALLLETRKTLYHGSALHLFYGQDLDDLILVGGAQEDGILDAMYDEDEDDRETPLFGADKTTLQAAASAMAFSVGKPMDKWVNEVTELDIRKDGILFLFHDDEWEQYDSEDYDQMHLPDEYRGLEDGDHFTPMAAPSGYLIGKKLVQFLRRHGVTFKKDMTESDWQPWKTFQQPIKQTSAKKFLKCFDLQRKGLDESYSGDPYIEELFDGLNTMQVTGPLYHGSGSDEEGHTIEDFNHDWSDWGAVWFADNGYIAREFALSYNDMPYGVLITAETTEPLNLVNIPDLQSVEELMEMYGADDLRELIPHLDRYDGWITSGSIGREIYDDIAVWNLDKIRIVEREQISTDD